MLIVIPSEKVIKINANTSVKKSMIKCSEVCLMNFEKITDYINNTGYAYLTITGNSFYKSSWEGFILNMKQA